MSPHPPRRGCRALPRQRDAAPCPIRLPTEDAELRSRRVPGAACADAAGAAAAAAAGTRLSVGCSTSPSTRGAAGERPPPVNGPVRARSVPRRARKLGGTQPRVPMQQPDPQRRNTPAAREIPSFPTRVGGMIWGASDHGF